MKKYWNYEHCYQEAKKYKTRGEFNNGSRGAYLVASKNGWLDDYTWFEKKYKPNGYWNYEHCFEEAKKYKSRTEFAKNSACAYRYAIKHNWINNYTWFEEIHKPNGYWNYEHCYQEAKKYKTRGEFSNRSNSAYVKASKNGWLDVYTWLIDGRVKLFADKIDCVYKYYFEETNSIYVGRTIEREIRDRHHVFRDDDTVAKYAKENGFAVPSMEIIEDNLTIEEGLAQEDYWKNYYKDRGYNVLNIGKTGVGSGSIGAIGCGKWTKEKVFEEARKYKTKNEFANGSNSAYVKASKNGWLEEMDWFVSGHKNHRKSSSTVIQYTKDGQFIKEYPSMMEAERQTGICHAGISSCCNRKTNSTGGFIFKYA